jgi:hypothetical protein
MSAAPECRHARLHIGGEPHRLPADVEAHLTGCADCRRFRDETLTLDGRLRSALELPLEKFRAPAQTRAPAPTRWALAASVLLAICLGAGFWLLRPPPALAGEVVEHVLHEAGSWDLHEPLPAAQVAEVLDLAGVKFDTRLPIVYAMACPFRGQRVPHFVVRTPEGPMTVMLLADQRVAERTPFAELGMRGVLLPAGEGSVAVLSRGGAVPAQLAAEIAGGVSW